VSSPLADPRRITQFPETGFHWLEHRAAIKFIDFTKAL
jgi:hypothetical protein